MPEHEKRRAPGSNRSPSEDTHKSESGTSVGGATPLPFRPLGEVEDTPVEWSWPGRLARGEITLLAGSKGLGKSHVLNMLAGRLATGLPVDPSAPALPPITVLILTQEDSPKIVRRRILATVPPEYAEEISRRVLILDAAAVFPAESGRLEAAIRLWRADVVIIDPFSDYMTGDGNDSGTVRSFLQSLLRVARATNCAIIGSRHVGKDPDREITARVLGSVEWTNVPRLVLSVRRGGGAVSLTRIAGNMGDKPPELLYTLPEKKSGTHDGDTAIQWRGDKVRAEDPPPKAQPAPASPAEDPAWELWRTSILRELARERDRSQKAGRDPEGLSGRALAAKCSATSGPLAKRFFPLLTHMSECGEIASNGNGGGHQRWLLPAGCTSGCTSPSHSAEVQR